MTQISLFAADQVLTATVKPIIASGDENSVLLHVDFDMEWDGYAKSAVFFKEKDRKVYEVILNNGECLVPYEVLEKSGAIFVGVRGVNAQDNTTKTTTLVRYKIAEGAPSGDGTTVPPTADVYKQLLYALDVANTRIDTFMSLAEGSTTGDAELRDLRVAFDGKVYPNAGTAVRQQFVRMDTEVTGVREQVNHLGQNTVGSFRQVNEAVNALHERVSDLEQATPDSSQNVHIGPDKPTNGVLYWLDTSEDEPSTPDIPDIPNEPDEPDAPEKTLTSISATYSGGDVAVDTAVTALTGIVVTAHYSDGSTATVTGYTLSGTIAEGSNTITVSYGGKTTTITVTGVAASGGNSDVDLSEGNVFARVTNGSGTNTGISISDNGVPSYSDFMTLDVEKLYFYFEPADQYKTTMRIQALYNASYGAENIAGQITIAQATNGTYNFITNAWNKFSKNGYVVYEIDVAALQAKIQAMYDEGKLDATKSKILQIASQQQAAAGSSAYLLYSYNG